MKKFYVNIFLFLFINTLVMVGALFFSYYSDKGLHFENWETESSLFVIKENQHYDVIILGNSHGRQFSRGTSHQYIEDKTGKDILNISRGRGGGGITNMLINLDYFYAKHNSADTIIYFLDPYVFYYEEWNEASAFLHDEPLDPLYFQLCLQHHASKNSLVNYVRTKFSTEWLWKKKVKYHFNSLKAVDSAAVKKRLSAIYLRTPREEEFQRYAKQFSNLLQLVKSKQAHVICIIPPTLLGAQPQADRLLLFLEEMKLAYGISYLNHYDKVQNPVMYTDHDHLNEAGVRFYLDFVPL